MLYITELMKSFSDLTPEDDPMEIPILNHNDYISKIFFFDMLDEPFSINERNHLVNIYQLK